MSKNEDKNSEKEEPKDSGVSNIENAEKAALDAVELAQKEILYVRAEFENYRKRVLKEQEQAIRFGNQNFITELLAVVDYLDKAVELGKPLKEKDDSPEVKNFVTGIELTQRELLQLMGRFGAEFVGQVGEMFDPTKHEAIAEQESDKEKGTVLLLAQRGCMLQGRLIKPAKVVVAK